jgi:M6 family metalloprotease-like protein
VSPRRSPSGRRLGALLLPLALLLAAADGGAGPATGFPRARPGYFEVDGLDFRPTGAWRRGTSAVRALRNALLQSHDLAGLNAAAPGRARLRAESARAATAVTGSYYVPVVPIAFANAPPPYPASQYQSVLFDAAPVSAPYSVRSYYAEVSRGLVQIDGVVLDWVTADSNDTYYEDGCNGVGVVLPCPHGGTRFGELLLEALARNDDGRVDWGAFDNDGPDGLPNSGDDDGVVDFVTFLQPEVDGACGGSHIWAHRYDLSVWNGGSPYVTRSPRRDAAGQAIPGSFIQIRDYTMQSAIGGATACDPGGIMPIGTVAHETGHAFGLPDLYDTNLQSPAVTQGIGEWGIMGSGNYTQPYSPSAFEAWSLAELGWVVVDTLRQDQRVELGPVAISDTVRYLAVPNTDEYFLFENRQPIGSDSAQLNPVCQFHTRSCAKAPGLLIWHIDQGQIAAHGFRQDNRVNSGPVHGVALVQADGLDDLGRPGGKNRGDPGDSWPGSTGAVLYSTGTTPAALDNQGRTAGFVLDSISQLSPGGAVGFRLTMVPPGQVLLTLAGARDQLLGQSVLGVAQEAYLDTLGNRNGRYDVGDFLAYYRTLPASARPRTPLVFP